MRNEKASRREIIAYTKLVLKNNADIIYKEYSIVIPKNIMNMDNGSFSVFVENLLTLMTKEGWVAPEIGSVVSQLESCNRIYRDYNRSWKNYIR